jgi:alkylated DNA repair dioxygenase AlkB
MPLERNPVVQEDMFSEQALPLPEGMVYQRDFLTHQEEAELVDLVSAMPLTEMRYKDFTARRRVLSFGVKYDFDGHQLQAAPALPMVLDPLRRKVSAWLGVVPETFTQTLISQYREGTQLGWHRDVPDFEDVVGVSLLSEAVMRFRPYPPRKPKKTQVIKLMIEPRSIYLLRGPARWAWQHSVASARSLRYSITFRTAVRKSA